MASRIEPLDQERHADLRVDGLSDGGGRWHGFVELVVAEFPPAAAHYPLFLAKNGETGRFVAGMLHGFAADGRNGARGRPEPGAYLPFAVRRELFFAMGEHLGLDMADPRVGRPDGDRLFDMDGRPSAELRGVQHAIAGLKQGRPATEAFVLAMLHHRLVEPMDVSLRFDDGERLDLAGLYTISLDRLDELPDGDALALFRAGHLRLAHAMAGSLHRLAALAERRNGLAAGVNEGRTPG